MDQAGEQPSHVSVALTINPQKGRKLMLLLTGSGQWEQRTGPDEAERKCSSAGGSNHRSFSLWPEPLLLQTNRKITAAPAAKWVTPAEAKDELE